MALIDFWFSLNARIQSGGETPSDEPSMDFSNQDNSQYLALF